MTRTDSSFAGWNGRAGWSRDVLTGAGLSHSAYTMNTSRAHDGSLAHSGAHLST